MNSSSHIKTQKLTGENWVKGRETIQFYKSGMKNGINVNISVIIKSSHYTPPGLVLNCSSTGRTTTRRCTDLRILVSSHPW